MVRFLRWLKIGYMLTLAVVVLMLARPQPSRGQYRAYMPGANPLQQPINNPMGMFMPAGMMGGGLGVTGMGGMSGTGGMGMMGGGMGGIMGMQMGGMMGMGGVMGMGGGFNGFGRLGGGIGG